MFWFISPDFATPGTEIAVRVLHTFTATPTKHTPFLSRSASCVFRLSHMNTSPGPNPCFYCSTFVKAAGKNPRALLRVFPLHVINLSHAGIAYRCDIALWRDGYEILHSTHERVQPRKLREQLPLPVWYRQPVDSVLLAGARFRRAAHQIKRLRIRRPHKKSPVVLKHLQLLPLLCLYGINRLTLRWILNSCQVLPVGRPQWRIVTIRSRHGRDLPCLQIQNTDAQVSLDRVVVKINGLSVR